MDKIELLYMLRQLSKWDRMMVLWYARLKLLKQIVLQLGRRCL